VVPVAERATITRIGRGVDHSGRLDPQAIETTLQALRDYVTLARQAGARGVAAVATSALRDAANGDAFLGPAAEILGSQVEVISGTREAELTFRGAVQGLELQRGPVTVVDVGGGSTELVQGSLGGGRPELTNSVSLDIGSVRLTERHLAHDPPRAEEITALQQGLDAALAEAAVQPRMPLVGIAGTVTTLAALAHQVEPYDPERIHGTRLSGDTLGQLVRTLASRSTEERKALPGLEPGRADVILAGALIVQGVLRHAGGDEVIVSHGGVRMGLADELLAARGE
jgi:exopolyphosphatase/guanosine-5'-triphosphate,3'-diphosphate pyrophosphatase